MKASLFSRTLRQSLLKTNNYLDQYFKQALSSELYQQRCEMTSFEMRVAILRKLIYKLRVTFSELQLLKE